MTTLRKTDIAGTVTWLGQVPPGSGTDVGTIRARARTAVMAGFDGFDGDSHCGATRPSCVRVKLLHPQGTEIRNTRQLSILSAEDCGAIADAMGLDWLNPEWLGASMVVTGIPDFTHIPPGSRLQTGAGTTLTIDLENEPCNWPGKEIEADRPGFGKAFRRAAEGRRGVTAWVERPGPVALGDAIQLYVPTQRAWQPDTRG
ncbi:MAG: MOSC domain-containing protein [Rhodobacter sp.]|nr:MOSC domain-containing protein [Rhodobacter sp.]